MNYLFSNRMSGLQPSAIREILKMSSDPSVISLAAGNPAPEAFPKEEIAAISQEILTNNPIAALQYSLTEGYPALRDTLKDFVASRYGIGKSFDELIVVSGAQQGMELTCKVLCNEGDTVICEDPSFIGSLNSFRSYKANLVGVEMEEDGMNMAALEKAVDANPNTRFIYVIPNFQNPTGKTMSYEKRKALYEIAKARHLIILEDNPYGDLRFAGEDIPSIKSMDTEGIVIYVGSFSKVLAPGMRVGYLVGHQEIVAKIIVAKQCTDVHSNILAQMICHEFMTTRDMAGHLQKLKAIYKHKCELMLGEMDKHFAKCVTYTRPQGGLFIWCTLPDGVDMVEFCTRAVKEYKVAVVPGSAFSIVEGTPTQSFRMNFSTPTDEQIIKGIEILGKMTHEL
ncbi:GntR family transcriptional regulator [Sporanaerobium hydrogeniformans]|uniref:GntR family transcriptional regulator n=1 Tax=Sporanaerobium hydrogeniformans TaxID=3072179 RepID=A0AC61DFR0_9FIRM|nr:PLP-dependent aminotransferase family protein [Sporanaerobium hydrogeniformans]PHV71683.1 GntR family transcriptional regulator [Sporanaerobium hydrogeniformans]